MFFPRTCLLGMALWLSACGSEPETASVSPPAASAVSAPVTETEAVSASAIIEIMPPAVASQASEAAAALPESEPEPPPPVPPPTAYGADGMHPICEAYFQRAHACFARAPASEAAALQQSLHATRQELLPADADTCTAISQQFDEMVQAMGCE